MAISTAGAIVEAALKEIGKLSPGETMSAEDGSDGLDAFNAIIDADRAQRLYLYTVTRTTWTISSGDGEYTVGPGADVNIARPVSVEHVNYQDTTSNPDQEYKLTMLTDDAYSNIPQKDLTATLPGYYYYNPTFPNATLKLWPVPLSATLQGVIYAATGVAEFAALTTSLSLPPGYRRMYIKRLAADIAGSYGRSDLAPGLQAEADEALSLVKAANLRMADLTVESAALGSNLMGGWNIRLGP